MLIDAGSDIIKAIRVGEDCLQITGISFVGQTEIMLDISPL